MQMGARAYLRLHPKHHFICCTIEGEVKFAVCCSFKSGLFVSGAIPPHCHFTEDEAKDISQVFRLRGVVDTTVKVIERESGCGSGRHPHDG